MIFFLIDNTMKQIFITLLFLFSAIPSFSQELKVKSFTHDEMNLEARLDGGRTDLNGKQCALVKVMVRDNITKCKGGNVGYVIAEGIVKKIFVSPSARFLELEFQYNFPLKITFADYGYATLTEGSTYTITLVDAYLMSQQPGQTQNHPQTNPLNTNQQSTLPSTLTSTFPTRLTSTLSTRQQPDQMLSPTLYNRNNVISLIPPLTSSILPITVNGVSFNMIKVDGGMFVMGATKEMKKPYDDEKPAHRVTLSSYYIGETEVTQALWIAVMGSNPSSNKGDNLPVENITWNDCKNFIFKLNKLTGRNFRLPYEAEWEFAARGGNRSLGTQYSGSKNISDVAWYDGNSCITTHPVGTKNANELGIYDMSGNVWEWCQDWFGNYADIIQRNPKGPLDGTVRVRRGGSWTDDAWICRTSYRFMSTPERSYDNLGFRLALSMD